MIELVSGAINWDVTLFVDEFPKAGEEVKVKKVINVAGGKGANTAVASARILNNNNKDRKVGILGALGNDAIGDKQISILEQEGVDVSCIKRFNVQSGQAYILVDKKGENMILTYKAVNDMLKAEMLDEEHISNTLKDVKHVVVIDPPISFASSLIDKARALDKRVTWAPALLTRLGYDALKDSISKVDYLILNEHECLTLADATDIMQGVKALKARKVIVTLGSKGCIMHWSNGNTLSVPALDLNAIGMQVKSTVGAGDVLIGAFVALLLRGYGEAESLFLANIAAALKVTKEETRACPYYSELLSMLDNPQVSKLMHEIKVI
jgi:ribokinase